MSSYKTMLQAITFRFNDKIKNACKHLFYHFNINQFYYCKITNDGHLTSFDSDIAWSECFEAEKLYLTYPYFSHPQCLQEGIELIKETQNEHLKKTVDASRDLFDFKLWFRIVNKTPTSIEEFGFSSHSTSETQTTLFLNEVPLFRLFIKKLKEDQTHLFSSLEETKIDIATLIGPSFYKPRIPLPNHNKKALLQELGISPPPLSPRETDIIKLLPPRLLSLPNCQSTLPLPSNSRASHRENQKQTLLSFQIRTHPKIS